jgi:hypothetical protein
MRKKVIIGGIITLILAAPLTAQDLEDFLQKHYIGKSVQIKLPIPSHSPLMIYPQREKKIDAPLYSLKMSGGEVALETGVIAVIKNVDVKRNEITFDLVGVGLEPVGTKLSPDMLTEDIWGAGKGQVRLIMDTMPTAGEGTIAELNSGLSIAMTTRALVSDDGLPPEMKEAIKNGIVMAGMNMRAVYLTLGDPTDIIRELHDGILDEAWLYDREDFTTLMVLFRNGLVFSIREF